MKVCAVGNHELLNRYYRRPSSFEVVCVYGCVASSCSSHTNSLCAFSVLLNVDVTSLERLAVPYNSNTPTQISLRKFKPDSPVHCAGKSRGLAMVTRPGRLVGVHPTILQTSICWSYRKKTSIRGDAGSSIRAGQVLSCWAVVQGAALCCLLHSSV